MATRSIISKNIAESSSTYTGVDGELILDTVTNTLRVSDGTTAGGVSLNRSVSTYSDDSSVAIDITKDVAILNGGTGGGLMNYTLADGTYTGQRIYLVRGTGSRTSLNVIFSKLNKDGTIQTNQSNEAFGQFDSTNTCIWNGSAWNLSWDGRA